MECGSTSASKIPRMAAPCRYSGSTKSGSTKSFSNICKISSRTRKSGPDCRTGSGEESAVTVGAATAATSSTSVIALPRNPTAISITPMRIPITPRRVLRSAVEFEPCGSGSESYEGDVAGKSAVMGLHPTGVRKCVNTCSAPSR